MPELEGTSQGAEQGTEVQNAASQGEPRKKDIPGTPEYVQSQIDKYKKQIDEKWNQKESDYLRQLEETKNQLAQFRQEFETIKNPPKAPEVLVEPIEPPIPYGLTEEDALQDPKYLNAVIKYNKELTLYNQKLLKSQSEDYKKTKEEIEQERAVKAQQAANQRARAIVLGELEKNGLNNSEAQQAFDEFQALISAPIEQAASEIAAFKKWKSGQPLQAKTPVEKETFPLPPGMGGSGKDKPTGFMKSTDTSWIYKTK